MATVYLHFFFYVFVSGTCVRCVNNSLEYKC